MLQLLTILRVNIWPFEYIEPHRSHLFGQVGSCKQCTDEVVRLGDYPPSRVGISVFVLERNFSVKCSLCRCKEPFPCEGKISKQLVVAYKIGGNLEQQLSRKVLKNGRYDIGKVIAETSLICWIFTLNGICFFQCCEQLVGLGNAVGECKVTSYEIHA